MRQPMPERRASWTQHVHIENQAFYLTFGEYPDGRLGEIFVNASKTGTFVRGVLDALARVTSVAIQCGAPIEEISDALKGLNFPPHGPVEGSATCKGALSVTDWIGQEIEANYSRNRENGDAA